MFILVIHLQRYLKFYSERFILATTQTVQATSPVRVILTFVSLITNSKYYSYENYLYYRCIGRIR